MLSFKIHLEMKLFSPISQIFITFLVSDKDVSELVFVFFWHKGSQTPETHHEYEIQTHLCGTGVTGQVQSGG